MDEAPVANNPKRMGGATGKGFMPGKSGNPSGRPKGTFSLEKRLRMILEAHDEKEGRELALAAIKHAKDGNAAYFKQIIDRIDGPVVEKQDITADVRVVYEVDL